ncbi:hypothetical protein HII31_05421 [Pseudocercospora fuligena]|uniref:Uncharacterized protein n=1 Tax=Pseudocercospora fuligena TaxID=685502 RepID=A0A8H6VIT6_9PEZI|nr:hypothetical protein HII31_05421 [Pseudocercospora fuligena]
MLSNDEELDDHSLLGADVEPDSHNYDDDHLDRTPVHVEDGLAQKNDGLEGEVDCVSCHGYTLFPIRGSVEAERLPGVIHFILPLTGRRSTTACLASTLPLLVLPPCSGRFLF